MIDIPGLTSKIVSSKVSSTLSNLPDYAFSNRNIFLKLYFFNSYFLNLFQKLFDDFGSFKTRFFASVEHYFSKLFAIEGQMNYKPFLFSRQMFDGGFLLFCNPDNFSSNSTFKLDHPLNIISCFFMNFSV